MLTLTPEMAGEKLRELGIFTDSGIVMAIVQHLKSGGKQNVLYRGIIKRSRDLYDNPPTTTYTMTTPPIASNNTVLKIKKLLDAGELDWMTDELAKLNLLLDTVEKASAEDLVKNLEKLASRGWQRYKDDGEGEHRLRITQEAEEPLKDFGWSVTNLVGIGIPLEDTLGMLQDFDRLLVTRESSWVGVGDHDFLRKFQGFQQYLYLNHLVYLMQKYPNNPLEHYATATTLYTRGVVAGDDSIKTAGEDILRYEISRGGEYLKAYYESLKRYKRTPKRNAELRGQIEHLLKEKDSG